MNRGFFLSRPFRWSDFGDTFTKPCVMQRKNPDTGHSSNRSDDSSKNAAPRQPDQQPPASPPPDDPSSAQDDPDLPEDETTMPTQADITAKESVEYFTPSGEFPDPGLAEDTVSEEEDATPEIIPGTEADLSPDDLNNLGPRDEDMDLGEDESVRNKDLLTRLKDRDSEPEPPEQLDVPGAEDDDAAESRGAEDEENNEYSLDDD